MSEFLRSVVTKAIEWMLVPDHLWKAFGFFGQFLFAGRFIVQWIASEKQKKSVIPIHFWFFSLAGGVVLLVYAIRQRDGVFIVGQGSGLIVYVRNLVLLSREKKNAAAGLNT